MTIRVTLPPRFDGVVFAYPHVAFKPDRVLLPELQGVVVKIDGRQEPCDGSMWAINNAPVCVGGSFVAMHVINLTAEARELELRLIGVVDVPGFKGGRNVVWMQGTSSALPHRGLEGIAVNGKAVGGLRR